MFEKIKTALSIYPREFYIFVSLIIVSTLLVLFTNNYSDNLPKHILKNTVSYSEDISEMLYTTEENFNAYLQMLNDFIATDADYKSFEKEQLFEKYGSQIKVLLKNYLNNNKSARSCFYIDIDEQNETVDCYYSENTDFSPDFYSVYEPSYTAVKSTLDKGERWTEIDWLYTHENCHAYIERIISGGKVIGYMGFVLKTEAITDAIPDNQAFGFFSVLSKDGKKVFSSGAQDVQNKFPAPKAYDENIANEIINGGSTGFITAKHNGRSWIYAFVKLRNGHTFINAVSLRLYMKKANGFLYIIAFSAIFCLWLVQKNLRTNKNAFEYLSAWLLQRHSQNLTNPLLNSNRAAHALHFGGVLVIASNLMYSVYVGVDIFVIFIHLIILCIALAALLIYRKKKFEPLDSRIPIVGFLTLPLILHLLEGGFNGTNSGSSILWMSAAILLVLFLLGSKAARTTYKAFIILLFFDALIEINILDNDNYETILAFINSLLFFGFTLYASTEIYVSGSFNDYNRIKHLLEQLEESQDIMIQKEKMAALGHLIAGIAHEINNPIGAVKASSQRMDEFFNQNMRFLMKNVQGFTEDDYKVLFKLIDEYRLTALEMKSTSEVRALKRQMIKFFENEDIPDKEYIVNILVRLELCDLNFLKDVIYNKKIVIMLELLSKLSPLINGIQTNIYASNKVSKIVFALKNYSYAPEHSEGTFFDITASIDNVLILYNNQIKGNIEVIRDIEEGLPKVCGNFDEFEQVWSNLISNAIYAMPNGGKLTIRIRTEGDMIEVAFSDTGEGMSPDVLNKIFNAFYTTKPIGEGSGLGLDICKKIILNHSGEIWAASEAGKGTTFYVTLPINKNTSKKRDDL